MVRTTPRAGTSISVVSTLTLPGRQLPKEDPAELVALNDAYSERFGLDREVGRRVIAQYYGTQETRASVPNRCD